MLLELVVVGLKVAVIPEGNPATESPTAPLKPFAPITVIVVVALDPWFTDIEAAEDEMLKLGVGITMVMGALAVRLPAVPVIIALYVPGAATLLAANKTVLLEAVVAALNVAVTPAGNPDIPNVTDELKPPFPTMLTLAGALEPTSTDRELGDETRLKLGTETVNWIIEEADNVPEVPDTSAV